MNAVERVEDLAKNERQLTWIESRYWANQYLMLCRDLAIELDATRMQIHSMQYAQRYTAADNPPVEITPPEPKLSKAEATSKHMKAYWANRKSQK